MPSMIIFRHDNPDHMRAADDLMHRLAGLPPRTDAERAKAAERYASVQRALDRIREEAKNPDIKRVVHPPFNYAEYAERWGLIQR